MSRMISQPSTSTSKGLAARVFGVLTSPRATYADVAARPRWFGVLAVVMVVTAAGSATLFSTKVGQDAIIDQQIRQTESFGRKVSDAQYAALERMAPFAKYFVPGAQLVFQLIFGLAVAGLLYAIFSAGMGGEATFKHVFSVVAHSGVVFILSSLFVLPLDYARGTLASPTSLAVFVPVLDENSFLTRLLGSIDLFLIWWMISLAIGLGVLYKRRTAPIATTMLLTYGAIGLAFAAVRSVLAGA